MLNLLLLLNSYYIHSLHRTFGFFQGRLQSQDTGKHLHDVLDLLQKHNLVEADISAQAERIKGVQAAAKPFTSYEQGKPFQIFAHCL